MQKPLKIGVIGAGHLGKIHLKLINEVSELDLIGVFDTDEETRKAAATNFNCTAYSDAEALIAMCDVIDVVSPTLSHYEYVKMALKAGKPTFVEKPLCDSVEKAAELVKLSDEAEVQVQVGHVERFNPAMLAVNKMDFSPLFIEAHRLAAFNPRGTDVAVILDLMIHDIDIILNLVQSNVKKIQANGVAIISKTPDIANARIEFDNGCVANLTASRVSMKKMRKMRIFQRDAYISLDFLEKKSQVIRLSDKDLQNGMTPFEIETGDLYEKKYIYVEQPPIEEVNSIKKELELFAKSIINGTDTVVNIHDGFKALDVAYQILSKINQNSKMV